MSWYVHPKAILMAVGHRDKPGIILVRARCEDDMKWFCEDTNTTYWFDTNADYAYRCEIPVEDFAAFQVRRAYDTLEYDSLKVAAKAAKGQERYNLLSRVWSVLMTLQPYGVGVYNRPITKAYTSVSQPPARKSKKQRKKERKAQRRRADVEGTVEEFRCIDCNGDVRNCPCYSYLDREIEEHLAEHPPF